jgi:hypothetical protein
MDYAPVRAFLVGRCGKTLKEAAMTSAEEYNLLAEGHMRAQQEEWERLRWCAFMEWKISPSLKRRPNKPQDLILFPWEKKETSEVKNYEPMTEDDLMNISKIFGIKREEINNGKNQ